MLYCLACAQADFPELELNSLSQLDNYSDPAFEVSGLVKVNDKTYIVGDESKDNYLFEIEFKDTYWTVMDSIFLDIKEEVDLEAIDFCNGKFLVANEKCGRVIAKESGHNSVHIPIDFKSENPRNWGNAGWESLAIDCENQTLYLAKERQPRQVYEIDLVSLKVITTFNIPETESNDFSDAKFENGYLYLLERNGNYIAKIDVKTKKVVQKVSYRKTCSHPEGKLYQEYKYGMAEALVLTESEIWIGLDNNRKKVSAFAEKTFGMTGSAPVILKFKRPSGF